MRAQVLLHECRGLGVSPEVQERPGDLVTPQRRVGLRSRLADEGEAVFVLAPIDLGDANPSLRIDVEGIEGHSVPELGDGLVQEPKVQVDDPQVLMRLTEVRVQRERPAVLLDSPLMLETGGYVPQEKRPGPMGLRKVGVQLEGLLHLDVSLLERGCVLAGELTDPEPVGSRQLRMRGRETRIERHGPFQQPDRHGSVAIGLLERAVALDPSFAAAHAQLARAYGLRVSQFAREDTAALEKAYVEVEKSLQLNPDLAEAHWARPLDRKSTRLNSSH